MKVMEEQLLSKAFEYTLVGGAFVYLLFFVTKRLDAALTKNAETNAQISVSMVEISKTLVEVSGSLGQLNARMETLERTVYEKGGGISA
jgi:hypothetical protein